MNIQSRWKNIHVNDKIKNTLAKIKEVMFEFTTGIKPTMAKEGSLNKKLDGEEGVETKNKVKNEKKRYK